jgi:hypothetical protein
MELLIMLLGGAIAGGGTFANDSIQAFSLLLEAIKKLGRIFSWLLLLFLIVILCFALFYGWHVNDGDIAYGRLDDIPYPDNISTTDLLLYLLAPIVLLALTCAGIPVSTTFLILFVFSSDRTIEKMIEKSMYGGGIALLVGFILWFVLKKFFDEKKGVPKHVSVWWQVALWFATGYLWWQWLRQDLANIAVFFPRQMSLAQVAILFAYLSVVLCLLFWFKGGPLQKIVSNRTNISCPKSATIICFTYGSILWFFLNYSTYPMSTTWVFVFLLIGRELGMHTRIATFGTKRAKKGSEVYIFPLFPWAPVVEKGAIMKAGVTALKLGAGLLVSIVIATSQNAYVFSGAIAVSVAFIIVKTVLQKRYTHTAVKEL